MARSKVIRFTATRKAAGAALAANNPLPLPPPQNIVDLEMVVPLYLDLVQALQLSRSIQITQRETLIPPPVAQPKALSDLYVLQVNLGI